MSENKLENVKSERTQLRRLFTIQANKVEEILKSGNNALLGGEFVKLANKAERLFRLDGQVRELMFSIDLNESDMEKEFDQIETYRDKWIMLNSKREDSIKSVLEDEKENNSIIGSQSGSTESHKYYKYPKLKFASYDGDIKQWLNFWSQFKKIHEDPEMDLDTKFHYLFQATVEGSLARELISSFPHCGENYKNAVELMKQRFGRDDLLIEMYVRELLSLVLQNSSSNRINSLSSLYDRLETQLRALATLGVTTEKYACMLLPLVESSLPEDILREWERKRVRTDSKEPMRELLEFLRKEVESEERINLAKTSLTKPSEYKPNKNKISTASDLISMKAKNSSCIFCEGQHANENCYKARSFNQEHISKILTERRCCLKCFKFGHLKKDCRSFLSCIICNKRHVPLACPERKILNIEKNEKPDVESKNVPIELNNSNANSNQVYLKTLHVLLCNNGKSYPCRLFFDEGSQRSYISNRLVALLEYEVQGKEKIIHSLFGGRRTSPENHSVYKIQVASKVNNYICNFRALNKEIICDPLPAIQPSDDFANELERKNIVLSGDEWGPIDILVGADVAGKLYTGRRVILDNGLVAVETFLGWAIMGKRNEASNMYMNNISCTLSDISAPELWRLDIIGIEDPVEVKSRVERELLAKNYFLETVDTEDDGRYKIRLPWLNDHPPLPTNFDVAKKRLDTALSKMTPNLKEKYGEVFKEWLEENIIEQIPSADKDKGHYLPHRPVIKEASTTKIRPVFDASAKTKGAPSLNQCLEKGPNLIELIPSLLLRFRLEKIGVISDVKKAFLQISVHEEDRDFLRFLWRDEENNLITFRHRRVVFGVSSSPFLLEAVFEHLLNRWEEMFKPECDNSVLATIRKLKKGFYVDNCVTSVANDEERNKFIKEATQIFSAGKFELRGWEWSDPKIIASTETPVLGILWDKKKDTIKINVPDLKDFDSSSLTRRSLLSSAQKFFDPIGILTPTALVPKLLIQQTWMVGGDWDTELSEEIKEKFMTWLRGAESLSGIEVPRWIVRMEQSLAKFSLHTFCDASQMAYAAVCFLRVEGDEQVEIQLVGAKSRVAPVKKCTIPRLELLAAVIGTRLAHTIQEEFGQIQCFYWSDSSTVLSWIKREEPWGIFVFNRVKEIKTLSNKDEWRHIPGVENPADLASRGCHPTHLAQSKWWEGPVWLNLPMEQWPSSQLTFNEEEIRSERKKATTVVSNDLEHESLSSRLGYKFKKYSRIVRVIGWMVRFYKNSLKREALKGVLTCQEIEKAERRLLRLVQSDAFQGTQVQKLSKLSISTDNFGLMRVKTKILTRKDAEDFKAPIVLPADHHITECLIQEKHIEMSHQRGQGLLNFLRERYWILRGRQAVRRILKSCAICQRFDSKPFGVDSPSLPEDRVRDARVFEVCGTDFAGPLHLRNDTKIWICIFTCAIYRAVHLEIVSSLSTEHFLMAFRRFIARRGRPSLMFSDNGTNFRGAYTLLEKINWTEVTTYSTMKQIEWRFNPPAAPWWGGFWERIVGILKQLLRKVIGRALLDSEELCTMICECESIINSRPITYLSEDPADPTPVTPSMFLQEIREDGVPDLDKVDAQSLNKRLRYRYRLKEEFRQRFRTEYLGQLKQTARNVKRARIPEIGEVVLIETNSKRIEWPLAIVENLIPGKDGNSRVATLKTVDGKMCRPIQRLYPLEIFCETKDWKAPLAPTNDPAEKGQERDKVDLNGLEEKSTRCGRKVKLPARFLH